MPERSRPASPRRWSVSRAAAIAGLAVALAVGGTVGVLLQRSTESDAEQSARIRDLSRRVEELRQARDDAQSRLRAATTTTTTAPLPAVSDFAAVGSRGSVVGRVRIQSPASTTLANVSTTTTPAAGFPLGLADLIGTLSYTLTGLPLHATGDVVVQLPLKGAPTGILRPSSAGWADASATATFQGDVVTLHIQDGGVGDADGAANGTVVDRLVVVRAASAGPTASTTPPACALAILTPQLPPAQIGVPYSVRLTATCTSPTLRWRKSGRLPNGLRLDSATGIIAGVPKSAGGTFPVTIRVTEAIGNTPRNTAAKAFSIAVS